MSLKKIVKLPVAIKFITSVGTAYLRFVWWSSRNTAVAEMKPILWRKPAPALSPVVA